ncbi:MAG: lipoate--protein ligase [Clostridia bacterium]|nr:lipoate--protein ligase [Clostridia bacterium]
MIVYRNNRLDPYFNLASEEYLIDNSTEPVFMLWRNAPAVIIGKNQNAYAEVDEKYLRENSIALVRRLTGGGAVFHDPGNVNFTFIVDEDGAEKLDFARFTLPIINALRDMGLDASLSGRNDIAVNCGRTSGGEPCANNVKKISGNAQCVRSGKIMHHGTLLYSADLSKVAAALRPDPDKIKSKGIDSVRSRVANIVDLCSTDMSVEEFMDHIASRIEGEVREFDEDQIRAISKLSEEKYSTWEWNWGRSKEYSIAKKRYFPFGLVRIGLETGHGIITDISIGGDFFGVGDISDIERALSGKRFEYETVSSVLSGADIAKYISGASADDLLELIF